MLRWGTRLLFIHILFIFITWLASYFPGLDVVAAACYFYVVWKAGQMAGMDFHSPTRDLILAGLIAQLPGLLLTGANILYYLGNSGICGDCAFFLQLWQTPFMPVLSFLSFPVYNGYVFYFLALFFLSPLYPMILWGSGMRFLQSASPRKPQL